MALSTPLVMLWVLGALVPGVFAMTYVWGAGVLLNVALLSIMCVLFESVCLWLTGTRSWPGLRDKLADCSALVTAWLIAICLPPATPAAILLLAAAAAIGLAKHAYGGLGHNIFNPAMVGYAVVLVSFPESLAHWPDLLAAAASGSNASAAAIDNLSGATALSEFRYREGLTVLEFSNQHAALLAQQYWVSAAFLLGGLSLLYARLIAWRVPLGMLAGVAACALAGYDQGSSQSLGGLWLHLTGGGFVAAALFVATDPVTHPRNLRHQFWCGVFIGALIYLIRAFGSYPDGIAFAVLLGNCLTPLLNRWHTHSTRDRQTSGES